MYSLTQSFSLICVQSVKKINSHTIFHLYSMLYSKLAFLIENSFVPFRRCLCVLFRFCWCFVFQLQYFCVCICICPQCYFPVFLLTFFYLYRAKSIHFTCVLFPIQRCFLFNAHTTFIICLCTNC